MITTYDHIMIAFYLVFMLAIGVVFRRMSKDTSDFFPAGSAMPWWLTGVSAWIFRFCAWMFTGAAGAFCIHGANCVLGFDALNGHTGQASPQFFFRSIGSSHTLTERAGCQTLQTHGLAVEIGKVGKAAGYGDFRLSPASR